LLGQHPNGNFPSINEDAQERKVRDLAADVLLSEPSLNPPSARRYVGYGRRYALQGDI